MAGVGGVLHQAAIVDGRIEFCLAHKPVLLGVRAVIPGRAGRQSLDLAKQWVLHQLIADKRFAGRRRPNQADHTWVAGRTQFDGLDGRGQRNSFHQLDELRIAAGPQEALHGLVPGTGKENWVLSRAAGDVVVGIIQQEIHMQQVFAAAQHHIGLLDARKQ